MNFSDYIIFSITINKYYIGCSQNLTLRLQQHNLGRNKSTKKGVPWILKYEEKFNTNQEARRRESEIKKMKSKKYIEQLISSVG